MEKLVLQDNDGKVIRAFAWSGEPVQVIRRGDTKRLELVTSTQQLEKDKVPFQQMGTIDQATLKKNPFLVGELGHLKLLETIAETHKDEVVDKDDSKSFYLSLLAMMFLISSVVSFLNSKAQMTPKLEEELKRTVVKIVKNIRPPEQRVHVAKIVNQVTDQKLNTTKTTQSIKRMGALSVLGSLKTGKNAGGLNLGAAQTTAGPGLGGTGGSGGVQTSLYAKGITSAPLGPGANIQGGGGYGTKGKGGGQAGYGKLALTGSTGSSPIPLGAEASVASGLDRDQIAAVINRNLGQVRFCYEQGLQGDPALNGRVAVDFTVGSNGLVTEAKIANSSMKSQVVEDCIVMRLKTWKFPVPEGGVSVKVTYPFMLRRSGQG